MVETRRRRNQEAQSCQRSWDGGSSFIGESPSFLGARDRILRIARTDATALIEGETGTGKELAARVIHYEGSRSAGPFIPLNCGALPDSLLESELFGHRRGAFTDAKEHAPGILLLADGGTLFLDEVDSLSMRGQVVLLRFLQERTFRPLGAGVEQRVDTRVICACNRKLESLVAQRAFREDLYYRLNIMHVELPPLRERGADVQLFASFFLCALGQRYGVPEVRLDGDSQLWLQAQPWPGNVRQLENLLEREFLLASNPAVLRLSVLDISSQSSDERVAPSTASWIYQHAKARSVERFDRDFLGKLMLFTQGNVALAARMAQKQRSDLRRLLQKYGISPRAFRPEQR
jgi:DNA-binding NtrC family response regulator